MKHNALMGRRKTKKRVVTINDDKAMSKIKMVKLEDGTEIPQFVHPPTIKEELPGIVLGEVQKEYLNCLLNNQRLSCLLLGVQNRPDCKFIVVDSDNKKRRYL